MDTEREPATEPEPQETPPRRERTAARLVELLALIPLVLMLVEVVNAPRLQFIDYWYTLLRFTGPDGSTDPLRLLNLSNEHPVLFPSLAYWLDAHLFAGDNRWLGVLVVLVAGATVLAMRAALPDEMPPLLRAGLVVAFAGLVFSLHGLWNYARAMSGIAWLTANLFVVLALLLAARGRWWPAWACGLAASLSYGTGFGVWPALVLLALLRREKRWRWVLPAVVGVVIVGLWLLNRPGAPPGPVPAGDVGSIGYNFLILVGHLWTAGDGGVAALAGVVILGLYAALATTRMLRERGLSFWWALAAHGFVGCAMIAVARVDTGAEFGLQGRYTSLSVLVSAPLLVLLALAAYRAYSRHGIRIAVAAGLAGVLAFLLGSPTAAAERGEPRTTQALQAIAIRGGFGDMFSRLPKSDWLNPPLQALEHYPFTDDFTVGCGGPELGSTLDRGAMQPLSKPNGTKRPEQPTGELDVVAPGEGAAHVKGWAFGPDDPIRCALLVDGGGKVVGAGVVGLTRTDVLLRYFGITPDVGIELVGPVEEDSRVVVVQQSGRQWWLPAKAPESELPASEAPWDNGEQGG